jgi:hypothetical protein
MGLATAELQKAVAFDRDGTTFSVDPPKDGKICDWCNSPKEHPFGLCSVCGRFAFNRDMEWARYNACIPFDAPVPLVHGLWHAIRPGIVKIMLSGRDGSYRREMLASAHKHYMYPDLLLMRSPGDRRQDSIVKEEILDKIILPNFNLLYVIDDRPQVCEMWRRRGIPLFQVTDPKIPPPITQQERKHGQHTR